MRPLRRPAARRVIELSSHNHKRGKRFRIWEGAFGCDGGPNAGAPCSPFGTDPGLGLDGSVRRRAVHVAASRRGSATATATCTSTIDELVIGVNIALDEAPRDGLSALRRRLPTAG